MTDTGGAKGFNRSRSKARRKLRAVPPGTWESGKPPKPPRTRPGIIGPPPEPPPTRPPICLIWDELITAGVFHAMFTAPELKYYLQRMARFIDRTIESAEAAATAFDVQSDSVFASLQRKIRRAAPAESAHATRAAHAFQSGSNRWAMNLAKHGDPTVFTVKQVALAVKRKGSAELLESARAILHEYLKEIVDSVTSGDPALERRSDHLQRQAEAQLAAFLAANNDPSKWNEETVNETMDGWPQVLLELCR